MIKTENLCCAYGEEEKRNAFPYLHACFTRFAMAGVLVIRQLQLDYVSVPGSKNERIYVHQLRYVLGQLDFALR